MARSVTMNWGPADFTSAFSGSAENPISENGRWGRVAGNPWAKMRATGDGRACGTQAGSTGATVYDDACSFVNGFGSNVRITGTIYRSVGFAPASFREVELLARCTETSSTMQLIEANIAWDGQYADIIRWEGAMGSFTSLTGGVGPIAACAHGDVLTLDVVGSLFTFRRNGVTIVSATDTTCTGKRHGMGNWRHAPAGTNDADSDFCFSQVSMVQL